MSGVARPLFFGLVSSGAASLASQLFVWTSEERFFASLCAALAAWFLTGLLPALLLLRRAPRPGRRDDLHDLVHIAIVRTVIVFSFGCVGALLVLRSEYKYPLLGYVLGACVGVSTLWTVGIHLRWLYDSSAVSEEAAVASQAAAATVPTTPSLYRALPRSSNRRVPAWLAEARDPQALFEFKSRGIEHLPPIRIPMRGLRSSLEHTVEALILSLRARLSSSTVVCRTLDDIDVGRAGFRIEKSSMRASTAMVEVLVSHDGSESVVEIRPYALRSLSIEIVSLLAVWIVLTIITLSIGSLYGWSLSSSPVRLPLGLLGVLTFVLLGILDRFGLRKASLDMDSQRVFEELVQKVQLAVHDCWSVSHDRVAISSPISGHAVGHDI